MNTLTNTAKVNEMKNLWKVNIEWEKRAGKKEINLLAVSKCIYMNRMSVTVYFEFIYVRRRERVQPIGMKIQSQCSIFSANSLGNKIRVFCSTSMDCGTCRRIQNSCGRIFFGYLQNCIGKIASFDRIGILMAKRKK